MGPPSGGKSQGKDPRPRLSKKEAKRGDGSRMTSARAVSTRRTRASIRHQNPAPSGLRVHQMRLGARKARHLDVDVSEVVVFGIISYPTLDVVACVWASVEERRHDLAFSVLLAVVQ